MKTLLVPTDFSIPADSAINYAIQLAALWDASLILYHSFIPFESGFYSHSLSQKENLENEKKLMDRLATIQNEILKKNPSLSISIHVDQGPEGEKIIKFCKKKKNRSDINGY
ncbi:universal stress protein [Flavobacterium glaciei]|uniref:Universal stress protein family protein n=1 Tax=Flavobacterium glaciei TaxID=386300 RepID=A0A562PP64_9FLAO|nr:universal stress protein [Flavobacterium glaciei]RDI52494.1 universal stress protein family protein [Flavobacterium glaciei]TWI46242.1 universal stress protein family protein [Flavobacterium glaciei]